MNYRRTKHYIDRKIHIKHLTVGLDQAYPSSHPQTPSLYLGGKYKEGVWGRD